jgi:hypothetical protein
MVLSALIKLGLFTNSDSGFLGAFSINIGQCSALNVELIVAMVAIELVQWFASQILAEFARLGTRMVSQINTFWRVLVLCPPSFSSLFCTFIVNSEDCNEIIMNVICYIHISVSYYSV